MIKYLTILFMCFNITGFAQYSVTRNTYKSQKQYIKFPDSINVRSYNNTKIDTIYIRNLEPQKKEEKYRWETLVPLLVAISGGLLTILGQYLIKRIERKGTREELRGQKRIDHLEQVSNKINKLSLIDPRNSVLLVSALNDLQMYVFENNLYIDKRFENLIQEINDYYISVAQNPLNKKIETETNLWQQFKTHFNK